MNLQCPLFRRDFLKATAAGALAGGLLSGGLLSALETPPPRKLRLLILGGTGFIGPWMAELAVARGHQVTLFNRGRSEKYKGSADGTETLYGNRDPLRHAATKVVNGRQGDDVTSPKGLEELKGREWDAVIDNSGYVPRIVQASAELLGPHVGQYLFISTVSVYASNETPGQDETAPLATLTDPGSENVSRFYGPLKAECEQVLQKTVPDRVTFVRPGYIVGPGDYTDRFTYWPLRTCYGGEVLVPGKPEDPVQFIDVRDLADFVIRCVEHKLLGAYNATGPAQRQSVADVMSACLTAARTNGKQENVNFTYVPYPWLARNGCSTGTLPILWPEEGEMGGFHQRVVAKAVAAGLKHRSVAETCSDLIQWWPQEMAARTEVARKMNEDRRAQGLPPTPVPDVQLLKAGITQAMETRLLNLWHVSQRGK